MAGMFFKARPFGDFIRRHTYSLLIPFLLFFILSYPVRIAIELWDYRSFEAVRWSMIGDLFNVCGRADYLYINVPLWFLLCLFWVQIFYWLISKLPVWANVIILAVIWIFSDFISAIPTPFMINNAVVWTLYFGLGNLSGKYIVNLVRNKSTSLAMVIGGGLVMWGIDYLFDGVRIAENLLYAIWCVVLLSAVSLLDGKRGMWIDWLGFFGINTLAILGFHLWALIPLNRIFYKITQDPGIGSAIATSILTAIVAVPMVIFFNRYFPLLVGKGMKRHASDRSDMN